MLLAYEFLIIFGKFVQKVQKVRFTVRSFPIMLQMT